MLDVEREAVEGERELFAWGLLLYQAANTCQVTPPVLPDLSGTKLIICSNTKALSSQVAG